MYNANADVNNRINVIQEFSPKIFKLGVFSEDVHMISSCLAFTISLTICMVLKKTQKKHNICQMNSFYKMKFEVFTTF